MRRQFLSLNCALLLIISSCLIVSTIPAFAAERVVLKYRIFRESMSVEEISTFAQTGKLPTSLQIYLTLARQDPKAIRQYFIAPVKVNSVILDRVLNSPVGNVILDEMSQVIHTPSRKADRQALRSALVISAREDGQVTLLEILQNYPTTEIEVEGERLESAYRQLRRLQVSLKDLLGL
ncbi:alpha/beta hydrolase [Cylindrospermum sp. FACHB-282]|uniref:alpha/beta hydrolase n=1 Tax=Cylindrospermum sp. FACHB-282 TaxID=2692794 RepID=UPI00168401D3|nr:alpha/beta hydrolase [Cylindrospermum sp. FACHB-282]MBD2388467.1 alpha/beta hydrolase [Cylindrospermum sp. FACHB-282]